jgi:hypothetical protein
LDAVWNFDALASVTTFWKDDRVPDTACTRHLDPLRVWQLNTVSINRELQREDILVDVGFLPKVLNRAFSYREY